MFLGGYGLKSDFEQFLQKDRGNVRLLEAKANLKGQRFAVASETSDSSRLNEGLIKELTGADKIRGSYLHSSSFQFDPTHHIWFACNHRPAIMDASTGMWRRVRLVPFTEKFLNKNDDIELREKLLSEKDGILTWLVDGAYKYIQNGLPQEPRIVADKTEEYRITNDKLRIFLKENLLRDVMAKVSNPDVYARYQEWCIDNNEIPMALKFFKTNLEERGIDYKDTKDYITYPGWKLKETERVEVDGGV